MKQKPTALILGATSDIGLQTGHEFARHGYNLILAARNTSELDREVADLAIRYQISVEARTFDVLAMEDHRAFLDDLPVQPAAVISVIGLLGSQQEAESQFAHTRNIIDTNYTGVVSILNEVAKDMSARGSGSIIAVTSVAGDRGRPSNYHYGSAKGALSLYLEGLGARLFKRGVHVMDVRPGFVATKMTRDMSLPARLTVEPERIARDIYRACRRKRTVVYTPWFWWFIMRIICLLPRPIFKRMNL